MGLNVKSGKGEGKGWNVRMKEGSGRLELEVNVGSER